jgi:hypothetical protein
MGMWAQGLQAQALATLGTASCDDSAAATGFHANQETVGACTTCFGGLISAFHDVFREMIQPANQWQSPRLSQN